MANTITADDVAPFQIGRAQGVAEYSITIDTTATDVNLPTPITGTRTWVVAASIAEGTAANVTFTSGAKTKTWELASNQGLPGYVSSVPGYLFVGLPGVPVKIQASAAVASSVGKNLILYTIDGERVN